MRFTNIIKKILVRANLAVYYFLHNHNYKEFHLNDRVISPLIITPSCIELEEEVYIGHHARIQGVLKYNKKKFSPLIHIGRGVAIQQNLHLTCANRVVIGANTGIGANVTITDINHPFSDINKAIEYQDIEVSEVIIGEDCKIYNNSVILPGVHIGRHVTIGANSVVNTDIPDYSVAVGAPAKVVRHYDFEKSKWVRIE